EERARRADVEARGVCAVLAHVARHQPAQRLLVERGRLALEQQGLLLLDERDVAPRVRPERRRVVVARTGPEDPVVRADVPLLAGDLARLAADAHGGVGEEADGWLL